MNQSETTHHFTASDGTQIFYRHRPAANGNTDRAIVLLHRGHEHSERMMYVHENYGCRNLRVLRGMRADMGTPRVNVATVPVWPPQLMI